MNIRDVRIDVDSNEPATYYNAVKAAFPDHLVNQQSLNAKLDVEQGAGDVHMEWEAQPIQGKWRRLRMAVERKTFSDFIASLRADDGRFWRQVEQLRKFDLAFLIIDGYISSEDRWNEQGFARVLDGQGLYRDTLWRKSALEGILVSVQIQGLKVVQCQVGEYPPTLVQVLRECLEADGIRVEKNLKYLDPFVDSEQAKRLFDFIANLPKFGKVSTITILQDLGRELPIYKAILRMLYDTTLPLTKSQRTAFKEWMGLPPREKLMTQALPEYHEELDEDNGKKRR